VICSLISTPVMGSLTHRFGRRPLLQIDLAAARRLSRHRSRLIATTAQRLSAPSGD
jgi:hypothetical protein